MAVRSTLRWAARAWRLTATSAGVSPQLCQASPLVSAKGGEAGSDGW